MKTITLISLFPDSQRQYLETSMMLKAQKIGAVEFVFLDLRQFGVGNQNQVDDTPYGGGGGMILRIEPLVAAIESAKKSNSDRPSKVILLTPRGETYRQSLAKKLAIDDSDLILVAGHYEGYDERVVNWVDQQISIGKYILTSGELSALVLADSITRLLPGVLANSKTAEQDSFADDQSIEHPHYTKPEIFHDLSVPSILLSGNHQAIAEWRKNNSRQFDSNK